MYANSVKYIAYSLQYNAGTTVRLWLRIWPLNKAVWDQIRVLSGLE